MSEEIKHPDHDIVKRMECSEPGARGPGLYLHLRHGRTDPTQQMDDWGSDGPYFGPFDWMSGTYQTTLRFGFSNDDGSDCVMIHGGVTQFIDHGVVYRLVSPLRFVEDMIFYDGVYYGDWDVDLVMPEAGHFHLIREWANARNIIAGATPQAQFVKLIEEIGELAHGMSKGRFNEIKDGIGDAVVVLTILAAQHALTIEECVEAAYDEIKDRKGRMVNGVFVKEADL